MNNTPLLPGFEYAPAVFAVGSSYKIMVWTKFPLLFFAEVNGKRYYDHSNGIIRSAHEIHSVTVPMSELDKAGEYTVGYRKVIERKPYFSTNEEPVSAVYRFRPVPKDGRVNIYQLADTHGNSVLTAEAGKYFGEDLDLLVLNGDTFDHSGNTANFAIIYKLCEALTGGERTCVFSRGNHDTRGVCAEQVERYMPTDKGRSYFTFRAGCVWGIVLDCAEDKPDDHPEYGFTNCCHEFRLEETEFIKDVIANADSEYNAPGVKYRLVMSHHPFTYIPRHPFDIEQELYREWSALLKENVKPQVLLSGHLHKLFYSPEGGELDNGIGQCCPVLVGSKPERDKKWQMTRYVGCAVTLDGNRLEWKFNDNNGNTDMSGEFEI